jgi:hypothetical protein
VLKVRKVSKESKVQLVLKALRGIKVFREQSERKVQLVRRVLWAHKEQLEHREQ